jgi:hypothetical protein
MPLDRMPVPTSTVLSFRCRAIKGNERSLLEQSERRGLRGKTQVFDWSQEVVRERDG